MSPISPIGPMSRGYIPCEILVKRSLFTKISWPSRAKAVTLHPSVKSTQSYRTNLLN